MISNYKLKEKVLKTLLVDNFKDKKSVLLNTICILDNCKKTSGKELIYLDVRYLRGQSEGTYKQEGIEVDTGDLVILVDGENSGEVFEIPCHGYMGSTFKKLKISDDVLDKYMMYFIALNKELLKGNKTGSAIPHLNKKLFASLELYVPSKEEQEKIIDKIDKVFELIDKKELNDREKEKLKELLRGQILDSAIHGKIVENNLSDKPVEVSVIRDNIPFEIPSNWKWTILSNFALIKARIGWQGLTRDEHLDSGDYYLITGTDFKDGMINYGHCSYVTKERYDMDTNIQLKENDVLLTKDGTIGKSAIVKNLDKPATLNSGVFLIRSLNDEILNEYIQLFFNTKYFNDFVDSFKNGMTVAHLTQKSLVKFPLPVPPLEEQKRIIDKINNLFELLEQL